MPLYLPQFCVTCFLAFWLSGCGSSHRITQENYDRLKTGMTSAEVEAVLGKPDEIKSADIPLVATASHLYENGGNRIVLTFYNDKLVTKEANIRQ